MKKILGIIFCIWLSVAWAIPVSPGHGTLSQAVTNAQPNDVLELAAGTYTEDAEIVFEKNLTIRGASGNIIIDGGYTTPGTGHRVFRIMSDTAITLNNLTIQNAYGDGDGGGVYVFVNCSLYMENCIVKNNIAQSGGGICNLGKCISYNNVFSNNQCAYFGGGIFADRGTYSGYNNIFSGNIGQWGANVSAGQNGGTYRDDYTCFWSGNNYGGGAYFMPGAHTMFNSDPRFVDADNGNFQLLEGSPCIDTGTSFGAPAEDILGVARPVGSGYDMGVYEGGGRGAAYVFVPVDGSNTVIYRRRNVTTLAEIARIEVNQASINVGALTEDTNFTGKTIIDVLPEGKPYLSMTSENSAIAAAVNNSNGELWVTASFKVSELQPIMLNGLQVSDKQGNVFPAYAGYVSNIIYANGEMTFRIYHFSEWSIPELQGKTYTGTLDTDSIIASGNNISAESGAYSTTGGSGQDSDIGVAKISGLAYATVLSDVPTSSVVDLYKPMIPSRNDYSLQFGYINRGNNSDEFKIAASMVSENAGHFGYTVVTATKNIAEWQVVSFSIDVDNSVAKAFERATLSATVSIEGATAVSYNAYSGAYSMTFGDDGVYGGTEGMTYTFNFETEGYTLKVLSRVATINSPLSDAQFIPGAKVKYDIVVLNESSAEATDIIVKDVIPPNCHLFYTDAPTVDAAVTWNWLGAEDNNATSNTTDAVKYKITIPAYGTVTASYTVTLD